ncbi:hypothetical protein BDF14DRAFT_686802 [Spinellus fusiger]|nr:hypothetical protein BDF14DRAFT_686802 [Spinellus fusiger]
MGSSISKAISLKPSLFHTDNARGYRNPTVGCESQQTPTQPTQPTQPTPQHHQKNSNKKIISVKKRKPRYKRVTKSIIGKPTNFKHTGHMGAGEINTVEMHTLFDIAARVNTPSVKIKQGQRHSSQQPHKQSRKTVPTHLTTALDPPSLRTLLAP